LRLLSLPGELRLCYSGYEMGSPEFTEEGIDRLVAMVHDYRDRCLWFLRGYFYPRTPEERLRVLGYIERYGDRSAYQKAAQFRRWLLHRSRKAFAAS